MVHQVSIKSLPQEWLWCETWCSDDTKKDAKTIDLVSFIHFYIKTVISILKGVGLIFPNVSLACCEIFRSILIGWLIVISNPWCVDQGQIVTGVCVEVCV